MSNTNIAITANRLDRLLFPEYIKGLIRESKGIRTVESHVKFIARTENIIAGMTGVKSCLFTNSGTDAIQLALLSLGLNKDSEVILPAATYISVALAIRYAGAKVIPVDISEKDMLADEEKVKKAITPRTKAIIMIHMFGHCCDIEKIAGLGERYNVKIVENICQSFGTKYAGKTVGGFGDIGALSFRYAKTVSSFSGNGGALLLKSHAAKERIKKEFLDIFRGRQGLFNINRKFHNISFFDALVVSVKIAHFREIEEKKIICKEIYERELEDVKELRVFLDRDGVSSVRPFYFVLAEKRDSLMRHLLKMGVECEISSPPVITFREFGNFYLREYPVSIKQWKFGLRLPLFSFMEPEEVFIVTREIKNFYAKK